MTTEKIYPEYINVDGGTQPRAKIDEDVCSEYEARMRAGDKFPPIIVFYDGKNYWLVDGFHRHTAHMKALPGQAMECEVHQGAREDAQWFSYSVNRAHGVRRTNEDKRRAIWAALCHPKAAKLSDNQIAEHVGVTAPTVAKYRNEHRTIKNLESPATGRPRVTRNGRTINTAKIGRSAGKSTKGKARRGAASSPFPVKVGLSKPLQMIALQFCPDNPHTAAATLIRDFPRSFLVGLVEDLSQHLKEEGAKV